jgi:hypothetical protein
VKLVGKVKVEDCFDGSSVYRYFFEAAWGREDIRGLQALGRLEYYPDFPRPFFRLIGPGWAQLRGVEGEDSCQVVLPRQGREEVIARLERHFL